MTDAPAAYTVDRLGRFVVDSARSDLTDHVLALLKRNVLDSIACAIGALDGELIPAIRAHAEQFSGRPTTTFAAHRWTSRRSSTRCWCAISTCSTPI